MAWFGATPRILPRPSAGKQMLLAFKLEPPWKMRAPMEFPFAPRDWRDLVRSGALWEKEKWSAVGGDAQKTHKQSGSWKADCVTLHFLKKERSFALIANEKMERCGGGEAKIPQAINPCEAVA